MRVAILQRVCPSYRVPLFENLSQNSNITFKLFIGRDLPHSKVKNSNDLSKIKHNKLKSIFFKIRGHYFPIHLNLIKNLFIFKPDIIICEGESNFINYLQAFIYKFLFKPKIKLVHWCFISLPGESIENKRFIYFLKSITRKYFDAFLVYSNFSRNKLLELNKKTIDKIYVATNVGNTNHFLKLSESIKEHKSILRKKLNIRDSFTVLYLGTLDRNKRPDILINLASIGELEAINFLFLGNGELYNELLFLKTSKNLENVYLPGKVHDNLGQYIKASDVLLVPGRGGIVISEAMAFSLPVVVNKCDGTEYDLIQNNINGLILESDQLENFKNAILYLQTNPSLCTRMGEISKNIIVNKYNTNYMANSIITMITDLCKNTNNT